MRTSIVPVLEARADELGLPRTSAPSDAVASAVTLADAIRTHESRGELPYNDTVALEARQLARPSSGSPA